MPKSKPISYEAWTRQLVENLANHFNLAGWQIGVEHQDAPDEESDCGETYAQIRVTSPYQFANMTFFKGAREDFDKKNTRRIFQSVVHELVHILLDPFCDWMNPHLSQTTQPLFMNTVENQTQKLTMVLLHTLPASLIPAL